MLRTLGGCLFVLFLGTVVALVAMLCGWLIWTTYVSLY